MIKQLSNNPLRVLIADDRQEVRSAMKCLLENQEDRWNITAEAADLAGLQQAVAKQAADVIFLDWELPGFNNTGPSALGKTQSELIAYLRSTGLPLIIVALSGFLESRQQAKAAGVDAFVCKNDPPEHFIHILKTVQGRCA